MEQKAKDLKISVITVCKNAAHLLKKTIESVAEQTYPNVEYVIVDGCSSDNTHATVNSYGDHVDTFISEPDSGIYDAMNKGIKRSTGDLVIFLNAGDYYVSPTVISEAINQLNYQNADLFFGRYIWHHPGSNTTTISDHSSTQYDWDLLASNFPHPATFYKRSLFFRLGLFDENFKILGDYEWNCRALVKNRIPFQYIDIVTANFTADGISNDKNPEMRLEEFNRIKSTYFPGQQMSDRLRKLRNKKALAIFSTILNKKLNKVL